jgi:hypothetical protein
LFYLLFRANPERYIEKVYSNSTFIWPHLIKVLLSLRIIHELIIQILRFLEVQFKSPECNESDIKVDEIFNWEANYVMFNCTFVGLDISTLTKLEGSFVQTVTHFLLAALIRPFAGMKWIMMKWITCSKWAW